MSSFKLIKILFGFNLIIAFLFKCFYGDIPILFVAIFFLYTGVFIGYSIAYYSIKYIHDKDIVDRLPIN